ncbi:MAG: hypothetical protein JEZ07_08145 [Phycisphaerae bacterium]|nr:hypothetical protein [Phycisphaerae bacterium]
MQWIHDNKKKLLVGFGILIMVGFLIPNLGGFGRSSGRNATVGTYVDSNGDSHEIDSYTMSRAGAALSVMQQMGVDKNGVAMSLNLSPQSQMINNISAVVFGFPGDSETQINNIKESINSSEDLDQVRKDALCKHAESFGKDGKLSPQMKFIMLAQEAHANGIYVSEETVNSVLKTLTAYGAPSISVASQTSRMAKSDLKAAIADYLAIARYYQIMASGLNFTEEQIRKATMEIYQRSHLNGRYVELNSREYISKVAEPTIAQQAEMFETYKAVKPDAIDEETNPAGYSYYLPDRVQVEYLKVDAEEIKTAVTKSLEAEGKLKASALRDYWQENKSKFGERDFPDVEDYVRRTLINAEVENVAKDLLVKAKAKATGKEVSFDQVVTALAGQGYKLTVGTTDFLSSDDLRSSQDIMWATMLTEVQSYDLFADAAFNLEGIVAEADEKTVKLYDVIGPAQKYSGGQAYLIGRVIAVDKAREPKNIKDDGRFGGVDAEIKLAENEKSKTEEQVISDFKAKQAEAMMKADADEFAKAAKVDFAAALTALNAKMKKDPKAPDRILAVDIAVLCEGLEKAVAESGALSKQVADLQQEFTKAMEQSKDEAMLSSFQSRYQTLDNQMKQKQNEIQRKQAELSELYELSKEIEVPEDSLYVQDDLVGKCRIFDNLMPQPVPQSQYDMGKSAYAGQMASVSTGLVMFDHFSPAAITARNQWKPEKEDVDETEAEDGAKETEN